MTVVCLVEVESCLLGPSSGSNEVKENSAPAEEDEWCVPGRGREGGEGGRYPCGERRDAEAERERKDVEGVGLAGWDGGSGLTDASSSAIRPARRKDDPSSAYDILGRSDDVILPSERTDGVLERVMKLMLGPEESTVDPLLGGTGMDGYGLFAALLADSV
jgi:hypothetical protein